MIGINGKDWNNVSTEDVLAVVASSEIEESFFYEFKDDKVTTKKLIEEISAFANTYGGYVFIGISDQKSIDGCKEWNEQKIHTTIHDSITPIPLFDVKKIAFHDNKIIYIIRIDQGPEPPYITNQGKIYERVSSGSFTIKDSSKLSEIYNRSEKQMERIENKISIPTFNVHSDNLFGYIDLGFSMFTSNSEKVFSIFNKMTNEELSSRAHEILDSSNTLRFGETIIFNPGSMYSESKKLPAHFNNFMEIMNDGSARMRALLIDNDHTRIEVNLAKSLALFEMYMSFYSAVMGEIFPDLFIYAKKYEALNVIKQFQPVFSLDNTGIKPDYKLPPIKKLDNIQRNMLIQVPTAVIVTDSRIPKNGLFTIDKRNIKKWWPDYEYSKETIINELFYSAFSYSACDNPVTV